MSGFGCSCSCGSVVEVGALSPSVDMGGVLVAAAVFEGGEEEEDETKGARCWCCAHGRACTCGRGPSRKCWYGCRQVWP